MDNFFKKTSVQKKKGLMLMILQSTLNGLEDWLTNSFNFLKIKIEKDLL